VERQQANNIVIKFWFFSDDVRKGWNAELLTSNCDVKKMDMRLSQCDMIEGVVSNEHPQQMKARTSRLSSPRVAREVAYTIVPKSIQDRLATKPESDRFHPCKKLVVKLSTPV
jgi:hypothetical protein